MKYIFFGTPEFAAIILNKLIRAGVPPIALVCNPDKPFGRKKVITPPPTKLVASRYSLVAILQPEKLDEEFLKKLRELNADFYIVAAYAKILKKNLLDIPRLGVIGVHPSLLPKYRGASPIQSAILNQEEETGVDLFMIDEKVDNGPVFASKRIKIDNKNYKQLEKELAEMGADLLIETLPKFAKGEINAISQNDAEATYTKKFSTEDGFVDYENLKAGESGESTLAQEIDAKIRALNPEPGVYTIKDGKRIKLLASKIEEGKLRIIEMQIEGKTPAKVQGGII